MKKERGAPVNRDAMDEECQFKFQTERESACDSRLQ